DFHVTGVQTCALPIWDRHAQAPLGLKAAALQLGGGLDQPAEQELAAEAKVGLVDPAQAHADGRSPAASKRSLDVAEDGEAFPDESGSASCRHRVAVSG